MATGVFSTPDPNGGRLKVTLLRDRLKIRGVPQQGAGFFSTYYAFFRGYGVILTYSSGGRYGLFASINSFFTATSVLYLGCEAGGVGSSAGSHIEAAVLAPTVTSLEAVCNDVERKSVSAWGASLTRSLARASTKNPSRFVIELPSTTIDDAAPPRDRDLVVHHLDELFPPAPTPESADSLVKFLRQVESSAKRLQLGGFYILAVPVIYNGIDLVLSAIAATISPQTPLTYVGMILYEDVSNRGEQTGLWVFRNEPMNPATLETQRSMAQARLMRYPPILQTAVRQLMPETTEIGSGVESSFEEILATRVTPTDSLSSLFRLAIGFYPREVLNRLGSFQPKYSTVIDRVRSTQDLKVQVRIIIELLYDLALASQRRCAQNQS